MTPTQNKYLKQLCGAVVRKRDPHCILCGDNQVEAAHIFPRAQGDWKIVLNPLYLVGLCPTHHNLYDEKERAIYFEKIIIRILQDTRIVKDLDGKEYIGEERAAAILIYKNSVKTPQTENPVYKDIRRLLNDRLKEVNGLG